MKRLLLSLLLAAPAALLIAADAQVQNVTMSPSSPGTNTDVTICFDIRNTSGQNIRYSVGFADAGYTWSCNTTNQINWVLDDSGVYRGGSLTVSGTATAISSNNYTDVQGPSNGLDGGTTTGSNWKQICFQTHIPPEFSGNYTVVVVPNRDGIGLSSRSCGSCQQANTASSFGYLAFTATGTALNKLNLEVCNDGTSSTEIRYQYRVTNYGESGVRITNLDIKYCYYDLDYAWCAQSSSNAQMYLPGGSSYCNTYNPTGQASFENFSTVDCGADGRANQCYHYTLAGGPVQQSMPYFVPPNGGYLQSGSPAIYFRQCDVGTISTTDDYANLAGAPNCGSGWSSQPRLALYNSGSLVCEWNSGTTNDPNTGVPHCGSTGGCNNCATGSIPNMARNASGPSNVVCLTVVSPTPTPGMQLTKVADRSSGVVGDTITYTISWVNNASAARSMVIWDTVPTNTTYLGCNAPVGSCSQSGGIVVWNLGSQAAGASGSVTFWVTISALPSLPLRPESMQALGPDPRSRERLLGLREPRRLQGKGPAREGQAKSEN